MYQTQKEEEIIMSLNLFAQIWGGDDDHVLVEHAATRNTLAGLRNQNVSDTTLPC